MIRALVDRRCPLLLAVLAGLFSTASLAHAADITLSDTCSLANAIRSANGDNQAAPANQCAAGETTETDTIIFVADVEITAALPAITSDIRIVGGYKLHAPSKTEDNPPTYDFSLLTINSGSVRIENLALVGVDDSALKIVKDTDNDLEVLFNLGTIDGNNAATHGGAIYIAGGAEVSIHSSEIGANEAPNGNGGAIYVDDSTLTIKWSNLSDNSASSNGGAIYFVNDSGDEHSLTVLGGRLTRNSATDDDASANTAENGGAIYYENGTSTDGAISSLEDNSIYANTARNGGSIYVADGKLAIDNSTIDRSIASDQGGGIYAAGGRLTVRHATIVNNRAATGSDIGVLSNDDENATDPVVNVCNSIIAQNTDTDTENSAYRTNTWEMIRALVDRRCPLLLVVLAGLFSTASLAHAAQPLLLPRPRPAPLCLATATAAVNIRDAQYGNRIGGIYMGESLRVLGSANGWRQVDYSGAIGWLSADYASLSGECNFLAT